jgi:FAD/FMN-containing dehydrogenase
MDRLLAFDEHTGVLRCEAGVLLGEILSLALPHGWFLPVVPGTRFVTVGGAIANDIHGKNHHRAGTFGCHVRSFELLRSDGSRRVCSPAGNTELYRATIGGLGLTGLITWAELQLRRVSNACFEVESHRFPDLDEFFAISGDSDSRFEYTVAWLDCAPQRQIRGRGIFSRGNHSTDEVTNCRPQSGRLAVPVTPPVSMVNSLSLKAFNLLYFARHGAGLKSARIHYQPFLFPLDGIGSWNRIYGPRGFFQHQSVIPAPNSRDVVREMLAYIAASGAGSFLAVLKVFGTMESPGLLSFPRPGATLAVDFPNRGPGTLKLLAGLDRIVDQAGGAIYPAKDARMTRDQFRRYFPCWEEFSRQVDPMFSSGFWRRVSEAS